MNEEKKICVFCFKDSEDFKAIAGDDVKEMLAVVLFKVNWNNGNEISYMCSICSSKLSEAFNFKADCLYVENQIVTHITLERSQIDLKEIYLKKHQHEQLVKIEEGQNICRLCLKLVHQFVSYGEVEADADDIIKKCIPEVNFNITEDPIICMPCFDSLNTHGTFIKTCIDTHERGEKSIETVLFKSEVSQDNEYGDIKIEESDVTMEEKTLVVLLNKLV